MKTGTPVTEKDRKRLLIVSLGMIFLIGILIIKFFWIQIIEEEYWKGKAEKQHFITVNEPFQRGGFWAISQAFPPFKQPLVFDLQQYHLHADTHAIPAHLKEGIASEISSRIHGKKKSELIAQLEHLSKSRTLAFGLTPDERKNLEQWWHSFARNNKLPRNALFFVPDWHRSYPCGSLMGQVLHTIQALKNEQTKQAIPTGGLELFFNPFLRGKEGKRYMMRSPRHCFESGNIIQPPLNGKNIVLTIDPYIQAIVEDELEQGILRSRAKGGWAVMMNPFTGEILALGQYPFFKQENYSAYFNDPILVEHTRLRAVSEAHEPGSVMKAITLALALLASQTVQEQGKKPLFTIEEKIATSNSKFPGRSKPLVDTHLHYFLNFYMAIQKSSNIYVGRIIERVLQALGHSWYRIQLQEVFGFGLRSGIEYPSENIGVIPTPGKKHSNGKLEWSPATPYSLAMGHNIQANSIQLARAFAVIANGGYLVKPTLISAIEGEAFFREPPRKVLPTDIAQEMVKAMRYSVKKGGTCMRADIPGYTEAGKSGTAKKLIDGKYSEKQYVSSFIGFSPALKPAFVLLVSFDEPAYGYIPGYGKNHHGGNCAAQTFRRIGSRTLEYLGVPQDDPGGYPVGDPRRDTSTEAWHKETLLLHENYEKWNIPKQLEN